MEKFTEQEVRNYERKNKSFAAYGSEGTVFQYEKYAVKLFKKVNGEEFMNKKEEKLKALLTKDLEGFQKPEFLVYDENEKFAGYAMNFVESKGDVADFCYKKGYEHTLDEKIELLLKVEKLIKLAHKKGIILNDVAIWNFLVTDNNNVVGIDTDNFQFDNLKSETKPSLYLPYYQGLCNKEGFDENSDKFSFALFALGALFENHFTNELLEQYSSSSSYLKSKVTRLDVPEEVKDELMELISENPNKEWIGKTLVKVSSGTKKFLK